MAVATLIITGIVNTFSSFFTITLNILTTLALRKTLSLLRDGPLENLWGWVGGGGGAGEVQKKNSRKGKFNLKKFLHAN